MCILCEREGPDQHHRRRLCTHPHTHTHARAQELEAQRLESGALLRGPLSAYSLRVSLADVHLDKASGAPRLRPASAPPAASRELLLGRMLPRVGARMQGGAPGAGVGGGGTCSPACID